jgi:aryl-alcohol dehydrogenase
MEFTAAVMREGKHDLAFEKVHLRELRRDEVLVRLVACGICHSDVAMIENKFPIVRPVILGHEGSGIVERVGSAVTKVVPGDPVVLTFASCGYCPSCNDEEPAYCHEFGARNTSGRRADGSSALDGDGGPIGAHFFGQSSFAAYSVANERNVVQVNRDAPLELLGPLGCGIQTGAGAILNSLHPRSGQSLVVIGAGGVGLSALMAGVIAGCHPIILSEPNAARRELGRQLGATHVIDPMQCKDLSAEIVRITGVGADCIFDTSGLTSVIEACIVALAPRGKFGFVAFQTIEGTASFNVVATVSTGKTIRGICEGDSIPEVFIPQLVEHYMAGRFPIDRLVKFYDFADLNRAIADQTSGAVIKPIVRFPAA